MATLEVPAVSELEIDGVVFPPVVRNPPGSSKSLFLGGAGVRSLEINGKVIKFTSIGVYMEPVALPALSAKWKDKTAEELADSLELFTDIVTGPFEKFTKVTMLLPLSGQQYSDKVMENCVAQLKAVGIFTDAEAEAVEKFKAAFKEENFPPGASILFTQSPSGSLTIAFSKDSTLPESAKTVIENQAISSAVLESIIGQHGVSPATKRSLAARTFELLNGVTRKDNGHVPAGAQPENGQHTAEVPPQKGAAPPVLH